MIDRKQRYRGCLLGLAVGDALGTTLEFCERGTFTPITDMVGGGPFRLKAGEWTDDTSMALCLAHSLLYKKGFDAEDQMRRYCNWREHGYMSSNGRCFDIGVTVSEALSRFLREGEPFAGSTNPFSAGNGSIMRLAPVPMYFSPNIDEVVHFSGESSRTTHAAVECIDACKYFSTVLFAALNGESKSQLLVYDSYTPTTIKVKDIKLGAYLAKDIAEIKGTGYVIDSLEAALWCFFKTENFRDAVLAAANLGDDADTTAAVCGQIAGAYYGIDGIPLEWRERVYDMGLFIELADRLLSKE